MISWFPSLLFLSCSLLIFSTLSRVSLLEAYTYNKAYLCISLALLWIYLWDYSSSIYNFFFLISLIMHASLPLAISISFSIFSSISLDLIFSSCIAKASYLISFRNAYNATSAVISAASSIFFSVASSSFSSIYSAISSYSYLSSSSCFSSNTADFEIAFFGGC